MTTIGVLVDAINLSNLSISSEGSSLSPALQIAREKEVLLISVNTASALSFDSASSLFVVYYQSNLV